MKKNKLILLIIALVFSMSLLGKINATAPTTLDESKYITSISVDPKDNITNGSTAKVTVDWKIPNNESNPLKPGDTISIKLPQQFKGVSMTAFDGNYDLTIDNTTSGTHQTLNVGEVISQGNTVYVRFNKNITKAKLGVHGSFYFYVSVSVSATKDGGTQKVTVPFVNTGEGTQNINPTITVNHAKIQKEVNGDKVTIDSTPTNPFVKKECLHPMGVKRTVNWRIDISTVGLKGNLNIKDNLGPYQTILNPIYIRLGNTGVKTIINIDDLISGGSQEINMPFTSGSFDIGNISYNKKSGELVLNINADKVKEAFSKAGFPEGVVYVGYWAKVNSSYNAPYAFNNVHALGEQNNGYPYNTSSEASTINYGIGGDVGAYSNDLILNKVNMVGQPLSNAKYSLYQEGKLKQTVSSDSNGMIIFKNLSNGDYTVKESEAPTGYQLSNNVINVVVQNKKVYVINNEGQKVASPYQVYDIAKVAIPDEASSSKASSSSKKAEAAKSSSKESSSSKKAEVAKSSSKESSSSKKAEAAKSSSKVSSSSKKAEAAKSSSKVSSSSKKTEAAKSSSKESSSSKKAEAAKSSGKVSSSSKKTEAAKSSSKEVSSSSKKTEAAKSSSKEVSSSSKKTEAAKSSSKVSSSSKKTEAAKSSSKESSSSKKTEAAKSSSKESSSSKKTEAAKSSSKESCLLYTSPSPRD